ncbi:MAG: EamA family transporter [Alphaproteobacteria bacterium]|nr:EamA family transporter [Alphaproteobacteria bacterium]
MPLAHVALAVLVAAVWGFNFVVIKLGLGSFPPILFSALRFTLAALPFLWFYRDGPGVGWRWVLGIGAALGLFKFSFLFVGMDLGMPAGLSSLVLQTQAAFTVLFAALALGERPSRRNLAGMGLAFAGIALIGDDLGQAGALGPFLLVILAAACWGVSNVLMKRAAARDATRLMVWVSAVPPLPLLLLSLTWEGPDRVGSALSGMDWGALGAVAYVAFGATILGFGLWGWLLRRHPAAVVAPFSLLVPVFGMSSAALMLGETPTLASLAGGALVVGGVAVSSLRVFSRGGAP